MFKAYKYRLYPTTQQQKLIEKHFGCCRYVYNWGLEQRIHYYKETNKTLSNKELDTQLKQLKKEKEWLREVNSQSLQGTLKQLDTAYSKFFKEHTGFPKFKSKKKLSQSFSVPQHYKIDFINSTISLLKLGKIKTKLHRRFEGATKNATVSKAPTGKYFISILVDDGKEQPVKQLYSESGVIGVDVGIKHFVVLSTGEKVENPKFLKNAITKLKVLSKRLSRKQKGSNNRKKAKAKLALLYEKITNQRNDFQHKLSAKLIRENQAIAVENLNVSGMIRNHRIAQAIGDAAWSNFTTKLEYKALWRGKTILRIGAFEPSSKLCSACGYHKSDLTLDDRHWVCPECNTEHDRDINAALNIKKIALKNSVFPACGGIKPVDLLSKEKGMKQEVAVG